MKIIQNFLCIICMLEINAHMNLTLVDMITMINISRKQLLSN